MKDPFSSKDVSFAAYQDDEPSNKTYFKSDTFGWKGGKRHHLIE